VFEGPSGAGKSTASIFLAQALAHCPLAVERILFGAIKKRFSQGRWRPRNWLERYVMKLINLAHIHLNKMRGRLTLVDRYIYLQPNTVLRRILQILAPRPDLLFVMIAPDEELRQRRGPEWAEETRAIYVQLSRIGEPVWIDTSRPLADNLTYIGNLILRLYATRDNRNEGTQSGRG
jgi:hypothetical protein